MSNMHLYSDEILYNVEGVLAAIHARGGMAPKSFLMEKYQELRGQWPADVINIALVAMGKQPAFEGKASERQMEIFVEQAKKRNEFLLHEIARMRAEKGK